MPLRTLLCYGDSNTHGTRPIGGVGDGQRFVEPDRWPGVVRQRLGTDWRVIEEGLPGRTTVHDDPVEGAHKNGRTTLRACLESHFPIDLVVLMLGTNDLKVRFAVPPSDIAASVERLMQEIAGSATGPGHGAPRLLLVAPVPILEVGPLAEMFGGGAAKSQRLSGLYRAAAERQGAGFLDAGPLVEISPIDGVHFEADQHHRLGAAMADAILAMT